MEADVEHSESRKLRSISPLRKVKPCAFALDAVLIQCLSLHRLGVVARPTLEFPVRYWAASGF